MHCKGCAEFANRCKLRTVSFYQDPEQQHYGYAKLLKLFPSGMLEENNRPLPLAVGWDREVLCSGFQKTPVEVRNGGPHLLMETCVHGSSTGCVMGRSKDKSNVPSRPLERNSSKAR